MKFSGNNSDKTYLKSLYIGTCECQRLNTFKLLIHVVHNFFLVGYASISFSAMVETKTTEIKIMSRHHFNFGKCKNLVMKMKKIVFFLQWGFDTCLLAKGVMASFFANIGQIVLYFYMLLLNKNEIFTFFRFFSGNNSDKMHLNLRVLFLSRK